VGGGALGGLPAGPSPAYGSHGLPLLSLDLESPADPVPMRPAVAGAVLPKPLTVPRPVFEPAVAAATAPAAPAVIVSSGLEDDPEMREVFLEEAHEVLQGAREALSQLQIKHDDAAALTTVRRAFHTLKGSARMVGLMPFGEAAWACEQLYNSRLAEHNGADHDLRGFSLEVCAHFEQWVNALAAGDDRAFRPEPVVRAADALRSGNARLPLLSLLAVADAASEPVVAGASLPAAAAGEPATLAWDPTELQTGLARAEGVEPLAGLPMIDLSEIEATAALELLPVGQLDLPLPALPGAGRSLRERIPDLPSASDLDLFLPAEALPAASLAELGDATEATEAAPVDPPGPHDLGELAALDLPDLDLAALDDDLADQAQAGGADPLVPPIDVAEATELDLALDFDATFGVVAAPPLATEAEPELSLIRLDWPAEAVEPASTPWLDGERTQVLPVDPAPLLAAEPALDLLLDLAFEAEAEAEAEATLLLLAELPVEPAPAGRPGERDAAAELPAGRIEDSEDGDAYKQIGPLRIGIPLFNIYLNEADELSRCLGVELAEWSLEQHRPVGDAAVALAHSLAGSSGTVGYSDLSQLARLLEHALDRSQVRGQGHGDDAVLFVQAADEIRRLLHLFAAGFLHAPDPDLVRRLHAAAHAVHAAPDVPEAPDVHVHAAPDAPISDLAPWSSDDRDELGLGGPLAAPAPHAAAPLSAEAAAAAAPASDKPDSDGPVAARPAAATGADAGLAALGRAALLPFAALAEIPASALRRDGDGLADGLGDGWAGGAIDEDIDELDEVDEELLPIFTEEAQDELLPQLHASLRDWSRRPAEAAAPSACMRCLHTLKGSARLAGAMRLGEMAHRLETAVARLAADGAAAQAADVERLIGHADTLQAHFDALLAPTAAAAALAPAHRALAAASMAPAPAQVPSPEAQPEPAMPETATAESATAAVLADAPALAPAPAPALEPAAAAGVAPTPDAPPIAINWAQFTRADAAAEALPVAAAGSLAAGGSVRVRTPLLDRLVNQAGEVSIARSRIESDVGQLKASLLDLTDNLARLRSQLRDIELQAETQIGTRMEAARAALAEFDPLEMDRFTRFQELTRMMAESVADVATVQRGLQRTLQSTEDSLAHQARMTRDMQNDLLRTRMVEFEGLSERLYRVVRQAAKETTKSVRLDIVGGGVEVDRGVLDRMMAAFEHLLRNSVVHGIEAPELRVAAGKDATGTLTLAVTQVGNEVAVEVRDDGAGLQLDRIRSRGLALGLISAGDPPDDAALANLIFEPGFSTATTLTGLAGRGIGMDVVRTDVNAMGGRIETASAPGQGTSFRLVLPLTTAVTQVVMLRCGERVLAVPSTLVEIVRRVKLAELAQAYEQAQFTEGDQALPFFWLDALLGGSPRGSGLATGSRSAPVVVVRSAAQRVVLHVDEVLGNREVVVKHLGPQLSRVPGLVGMTLLPSGLPALIYNPVALATLYGDAARTATHTALAQADGAGAERLLAEAMPPAPLVLVVDDSLTVRRITQRLLQREGYRVLVAKDGLDGLDKMAGELPALLLTDIEMPRMDGFDLVRNLRADARLAGLPVIMITSRIAQKHRDYAVELGVDHYLGKPYAEDELLGLVARYARRAVTA
jgi:chemosensory pili system protein ChpA (sensor histidine kinase/response regulator)